VACESQFVEAEEAVGEDYRVFLHVKQGFVVGERWAYWSVWCMSVTAGSNYVRRLPRTILCAHRGKLIRDLATIVFEARIL
jgi:hypothetical protein